MLFAVVVAGALLVWSAVANLILGESWYVLRNLTAVAVLLAVAGRAGLRSPELGLARNRVADGARWGAAAVVLISVIVAFGAVLGDRLGPLGLLLQDRRAALSGPALLYTAAVRIPLGTVVFEEIAFRGVLVAAWARARDGWTSVAVPAVVFGLYHLPPTAVSLGLNDIDVTSWAGVGAMVGAVLTTTVAGLLFHWLRHRSGSLLAPTLAHIATNVTGLLAAAWVQAGLV